MDIDGLSKILSIVVPVHNGETFLVSCLDKLLTLNYSRCEIIVVDDGSTDKTEEILKKYNNIVSVKNTKNMGVSNARNKGLEIASGRYVAFVDVDDEFDVDTYKKFIEKAEKDNLDIMVGDYYEILGTKRIGSKYQYKDENISGDEALRRYLLDKVSNNIWDKIFKKELLEGLKFDQSLVIGEDILFCLRAFMRAERVGFADNAWYGYVQNDGSAMHTKIDKFKQYSQVVEKLTDDEKLELQEKYPKEFMFFEHEMQTRTIHAISMAGSSRKNKILALKEVLNNININTVIEEKNFPKSIRLEMVILKIFGPGFHLLMMPIYKAVRGLTR